MSPHNSMFTDNGKVRERKFPFRMSQEEREFLEAEVKKYGIRDVATIMRKCIRVVLIDHPHLIDDSAPKEQG